MKIAISDDCKSELLNIVALIKKYASEKHISIAVSAFESGTDLLEAMQREWFDAVFLDIFMPGITGMDVAKEIRISHGNIKIIFLTSSPEFAVESYDVGAYHYILKPASESKIYPVLDKMVRDIKKESDYLKIKTGSNIFAISYSKIEYIEINKRKLFIYLTDGNVKEVGGKLSDYESELLVRDEFIKTHRSFIVNMSTINELNKNELITESGKTVLVSRALYQTVRLAYTEYLFKEVKTLM